MFAVAAVVATEPAIVHVTSHFLAGGAPGHGEAAPGDHLQSDYRLWLAGHQLEHGRAPWVDPYSFQPEAGSRVNAAWWPFGLPYWPLVHAFGSVGAWNAFTLLCLFAAGVLAWLWLLELGLSGIAAAAGGLAFEVAPYRVMQSRGHLLGPASLLLPLALWAFERARKTGSWWWWGLSWIALSSIPLSGQVHLALGAIPFYVLYAACRTTARRSLAAVAVGVIAAVLAGILIRLTVIAGSLDAGGRSLNEVRVYSATGLDLLSRHVRHGVEAFVFLGWLTPLLAIGGLVLLVRSGGGRLAIALGVGTLVPVLLALGTHFPLYSPLWHAFPPLRYPRVPERLLPIACLCLAALAAFALDWCLRRPELRRVPPLALAAVLAVAILADLHVRAFRPSAAGDAEAAYAAVEKAPAGRLVEVPVFLPDIHYGSVYLHYEQRVLRDRPLGYSTTAPRQADVVARRLEPLNCGDWTTGVASRLAALKASAITFHRGLFTDNPFVADSAWFAWQGLLGHGWAPAATGGVVTTFLRTPAGTAATGGRPPFPEPARDDALFCQGWFPADQVGHQMSAGHASVWVYGAGTLRLFVQSPSPIRARLSIDGRPRSRFVADVLREIRVRLTGERWHLVVVDAYHLVELRGRPRGPRIVAYVLP